MAALLPLRPTPALRGCGEMAGSPGDLGLPRGGPRARPGRHVTALSRLWAAVPAGAGLRRGLPRPSPHPAAQLLRTSARASGSERRSAGASARWRLGWPRRVLRPGGLAAAWKGPGGRGYREAEGGPCRLVTVGGVEAALRELGLHGLGEEPEA